MWSEADVEKAIAKNPQAVDDALAALKPAANVPLLDLTVFKQLAEAAELPFEQFLLDWLKRKKLLESFVRGLVSRGVPLDLKPIDIQVGHVDPNALIKFAGAAKGFRCRIRKGNSIAGSGVLVGPNTVLTAWHVIARAAPKDPQEPAPEIEVILSDNRRVQARLPPAYHSMCSDREYKNEFPDSDQEVQDLHDVAVLHLAKPAGALLGAAKLPDTPASYIQNAPIFLVHYPRGIDRGVGNGVINKVRAELNARWSHTIPTFEGSSGGACFDMSLTLLGIHQGKDPRGQGRLVPALLFNQSLRDFVANDQAPPRMWSLDETPKGEFVIGRQAFFEAFSTVRRYPRVRGIRIKRADATGDLSGLPFSYRILEQLVARRTDLRLMRLSFEALVDDVANEIARRATEAGIDVDTTVPSKDGVADGQSAPEGVGADRGRRVAALIDAKAAELGIEVWIFIDHPAIAFGDAPRSTLEAFVDASIRHDRIRLVIAGFEAVALPGQDFYGPPDPPDVGVRGLINEIIAGFRPSDVRLFLTDAATAAGKDVNDPSLGLDALVEKALARLPNVNGVYEPWVAAKVAKRLRGPVARWFRRKK